MLSLSISVFLVDGESMGVRRQAWEEQKTSEKSGRVPLSLLCGALSLSLGTVRLAPPLVCGSTCVGDNDTRPPGCQGFLNSTKYPHSWAADR